MSMTASGMIGERLVFSQRSSGQQVRFQKAQKDVTTVDRVIHRLNYSLAVSAWNALDYATKRSWNIRAIGLPFTGYNLFVKIYLTSLISNIDSSIYGIKDYGIFLYGKI